MLNHISVMGRLTADPELRRTGNGTAVASFTIACDRDFGGQDGQKETDFINCVAWRQTGEFVSKYFTKGRMIVVDGRLQVRRYTDKDGNKRTAAEVVAEHCYFGDSKREDGNQSGYAAPAGGYGYTGNNSYGQQNNGYGGYGGGYTAPAAPAAPSYDGYFTPDHAPASDFAMLEDDDAQLPF